MSDGIQIASAADIDRALGGLRRRRSAKTMPKVQLKTPMDDLQVMTSTDQSVVFGAYGPDEWIGSSFLLKNLQSKTSTVVREGTWITDAGWSLADWAPSISDRFNFISATRAVMFQDWGFVEANSRRGKLQLEINGQPAGVKGFIEQMDVEFRRAENLIEWVYGDRGNTISVPLNFRPPVPHAYPWLPKDIDSYIDDYLNSSASVLILIGPPGTGKTSFIKNLIHRSGGDAKVTYDEKVMSSDGIFASFIEDDQRFMIMEDADAFLKSRADGNTMMHRFLNVSDGLVSAEGKKLVFSTNLPSVRDIDEALMRPGRCFDVVEFRPLTRAEATKVTRAIDVPLPDGDNITLAQLFGQQPSAPKRKTKNLGFL